jgi:septum formation topological specificity factor MinE
MMPSTYKFYKKTVTKKKEPMKAARSEANPFQLLLRSSTKSPESLPKLKDTKKMVEVIFKYFDSSLNSKFQDSTKKVVEYIIAAFCIKVRKVVCKFIVSKDGSIYYLGIKDMYIEVNDNGPYDCRQLNEEL